MRLLIINFEMDRLSRSMPWSQQVVNMLAEQCEQIVVLTERIGRYDAPPNVHVEIMPNRPFGLPRRLGSMHLMNIYVYQWIRQFDLQACFIHMASPSAILLKPVFRYMNFPVLMWYAHGTVSSELVRAEQAVTRIVTSTPEGCRLPSDKIRVIGQGVDTDTFVIPSDRNPRSDIVTVCRISPRKRIDLLIDVMTHLRTSSTDENFRLKMIGTTINNQDQQYEFGLREQVWEEGLQETFQFIGYIPQSFIPAFYQDAFVHLNVSQTGSMDKTVVEALACGCPVLTSNEAFFSLLKNYPEFIIRDDRPEAIAAQVLELYNRRDQYNPEDLRGLVIGQHDAHTYIDRILQNLREII